MDMRLYSVLAIALFSGVPMVFGDGPQLVGEEVAPIEEDPKAVRIRLFSGAGAADAFEADLALGVEIGLSSQVLLEAKIARWWRDMDFPRLIALVPEIEPHLEDWDIGQSEIFRTRDDVLGYYNLFLAFESKEAENIKDFEHFAKESFWHHPELGPFLTYMITEFRTNEIAKNLVVPMETEIATSAGGVTTLRQLVDGKKAIMLEFWATWCTPCMVLLPELEKKAKLLEPDGVVVAGVNTESIKLAAAVAKEREIEFTWLVEPLGGPISRVLMIDSIPRVVLLSPEGKVLYNGHPVDADLSKALAALN
jgi:thiol-disulfide isomerase/thioredoxin